jgi:phosphopantothenate synthetase
MSTILVGRHPSTSVNGGLGCLLQTLLLRITEKAGENVRINLLRLGVVAHICDLSTQEVEARRS